VFSSSYHHFVLPRRISKIFLRKKCYYSQVSYYTFHEAQHIRSGTKVMVPFLNVIAVTMKFTQMIHTCFSIIRIFFQKVSFIFKTILRTSSKTLYTTVVKFPASTHHKHITKTLFQFIFMCKMSSTQCVHYRAKQVLVGGY
jgi:hypothetical protein